MEKITSSVYPIHYGAKHRALFVLIYAALPAVLLCAALLAAGGLAMDLDFPGMEQTASVVIKILLLVPSFFGAALLFYKGFRYGTFSGYFHAVSSRAFKRETIQLLDAAHNRFKAISGGNRSDDAREKEITKQLSACAEYIRAYKKFYRSDESAMKLETVTFNETLKMKAELEAEEFSADSFLAAVLKVRFCLEERFAGATAKAYKGDAGYVFISYSHRNSKAVLDVIKRLQAEKIDVWFDEGITEGEDWMDHIAKKIDGCSHFLMFQTVPYTKSVNCNVEVKRALKTNRTIIRVILEDSKLADGVEMYLDAIQGIDCRAGVEPKMERIIGLLRSGLEVEVNEN